MARDLTNAVALDFDYQEQKIYWSDVTSTASTISSMDYDKNVTENLKTKLILHDLTVKNPDGLGERTEQSRSLSCAHDLFVILRICHYKLRFQT